MPKRLAKREGVFPLLLGVALLSVASYLLVFSPKLRELRRLQAEVRSRTAEAGEALRLWGETAQAPGEGIRREEERVHAWRERVPDTPDVERLMDEVSREAVRHRLKDFRLTVPADAGGEKGGGGAAQGPGAPGEGAEKERPKEFGEVRFRVTFVSTYKDMAAFVDGIPRIRRLLAIRSLSVRERDGEMETSLDLSAYWKGKG